MNGSEIRNKQFKWMFTPGFFLGALRINHQGILAALFEHTRSTAEAFLADTKHPQFDCLVLDIQLSRMSGIELGQRLVAEGGRTPFIYMTAHDDPEASFKLFRKTVTQSFLTPTPKYKRPR